jgi:hypothetical protein
MDRDVDSRETTRMQHYFSNIWVASVRLWQLAAVNWRIDRALDRPVIPTKAVEHTPETIQKLKELQDPKPKSTPHHDAPEAKESSPQEEYSDEKQTQAGKELSSILPPNHPLRSIYSDRVPLNPFDDLGQMTDSERHAWMEKQRANIFELWSEGMKSVQFGNVFLASLLRQAPHHMPRGSIAIVGLTEAVGTKGRVTVQYTCVFQPKTNGVVSVELSFGPVRAHNQWPKGGW